MQLNAIFSLAKYTSWVTAQWPNRQCNACDLDFENAIQRMQPSAPKIIGQNMSHAHCDLPDFSSIEEQMQRISLESDVTNGNPMETSLSSLRSSTASSSMGSSQDSPKRYARDNHAINLDDGNDNGKHHMTCTAPQIAPVTEPIYAVVDLKNKYARRARIKEMEDTSNKSRDRPNSFHVTSSDYEEVNI